MAYLDPVTVKIPLQDEITVKEMHQKLLKSSVRTERVASSVYAGAYTDNYFDKNGKVIGKIVNKEISRLFNPLGKTAPGNESYTPIQYVEVDGKTYVDYDNDGILDFEEKTMDRTSARYMPRVSWQSIKPRSNNSKVSNDISSRKTGIFDSMKTNTDNNYKNKNNDSDVFDSVKTNTDNNYSIFNE